MSVYTPLSAEQLNDALHPYGLTLEQHRAASHGIENSTFLIDARDNNGRPRALVMTLFEQLLA